MDLTTYEANVSALAPDVWVKGHLSGTGSTMFDSVSALPLTFATGNPIGLVDDKFGHAVESKSLNPSRVHLDGVTPWNVEDGFTLAVTMKGRTGTGGNSLDLQLRDSLGNWVGRLLVPSQAYPPEGWARGDGDFGAIGELAMGGLWEHTTLALTFDGTTFSLSRDGVELESSAFWIGPSTTDAVEFSLQWNGVVANAMYWKRTLTSGEIATVADIPDYVEAPPPDPPAQTSYDWDLLSTTPLAAWTGLYDITGNGHHLEPTVSSAEPTITQDIEWVEIVGGGHYDNDALTLQTPSLAMDPDAPFSFLVWAKAEANNVTGYAQGGMSWQFDTGVIGAATLWPWMNPEDAWFTVGGGMNGEAHATPNFYPWGEMIAFVGTFDGTTLSAYVDGVLAASEPYVANEDVPSGALQLHLTALMARAAVWDRALTLSEVELVSQATTTTPPPAEGFGDYVNAVMATSPNLFAVPMFEGAMGPGSPAGVFDLVSETVHTPSLGSGHILDPSGGPVAEMWPAIMYGDPTGHFEVDVSVPGGVDRSSGWAAGVWVHVYDSAFATSFGFRTAGTPFGFVKAEASSDIVATMGLATTSAPAPTTSEWVLLGADWDGSTNTLRLFVGGIEVASTVTAAGAVDPFTHFDVDFDYDVDVAVSMAWDRSLTPSEWTTVSSVSSTAMTYSDEVMADDPFGYWPLTSDLNDLAGAGPAVLSYGSGIFSESMLTGTDPGGSSWTTWAPDTDPAALTLEMIAPGDSSGTSVRLRHGSVSISLSIANGIVSAESSEGPYVAVPIDEGLIHHVVARWDRTDLVLFIGGVEAGSIPCAHAWVGVGSAAGDINLSDGAPIMHVAFYETALSDARILAHFEAAPLTPALPPPDPVVGAVIDDFDRPDAPTLGTSSSNFIWSMYSGVWSVVSSQAVPTSAGTYGATLAKLDVGGEPASIVGASVTVIVPASTDWEFALGARTQSDGTGIYGFVNGSGQIGLKSRGGGPGSTMTWQQQSTGHDVSPGSHTLGVVIKDPVFSPFETPEWEVEVYWDGQLTDWHNTTSMHRVNGTSFAMHAGLAGQTALAVDNLEIVRLPIYVPSVPAPELTGGVENWILDPANVIFVPSVSAPSLDGGVQPWPTQPTEPIYPPSVPAPVLIGGVHHTWSDTPPAEIPPRPRWPGDPTPPWPPGYQYGPPTSELGVSGFPYRTSASCQPQLNDAGSGSFTTYGPGPSLGQTITYTSGGGAVFLGVADEITSVIADAGEEASQLVTVTTPGKLAVDWGDTVVYPDFGAGDPIRTGQPPQDDRIWGWPMNGLNDPALTWTTSVGGDNTRYGTEREIFALPDNWPDNKAQWMWTSKVDIKDQPEGWCFFRMPFGLFPGTYSLFVCAYDYAKVYIDGALVATIEQGGTTQRVDLDFDWDYHLIAIEAYALGGGVAGVLVSLLQRHAASFGGTPCYSRGGWKALERPTVSMRATVGKVLLRLVEEAGARGAPAGNWSCGFSEESDSAGNPWPKGEDAPLITTKVGSTYWDILQQFSESMIDFYAAPGSSTLLAFVKDEGGSSSSIPWTHTVDADSIAATLSGH